MVILLKSVFYFLALTLSQAVAILIFYIFDITPAGQFQQALKLISLELVISLFIYFVISIMFFNFMLYRVIIINREEREELIGENFL